MSFITQYSLTIINEKRNQKRNSVLSTKNFTKNNSFCIKYCSSFYIRMQQSDSATRLVTLSVILPLLLNITSNILIQHKQSYLSPPNISNGKFYLLLFQEIFELSKYFEIMKTMECTLFNGIVFRSGQINCLITMIFFILLIPTRHTNLVYI